MKKRKEIKKCLAIQAIVLILGTIFASGVNGTIQMNTGMELTEITIGISTHNGIEEITKQITIEDAKLLSELMHETHKAFEILEDDETISSKKDEANGVIDETISEMRRLNLLPNSMTDNEIKEVMSGEYGRRLFEKQLKELGINSSSLIENQDLENWKYNVLCRVHWSGGTGLGHLHLFSTLPYDIIWTIIVGCKNDWVAMNPILWLLLYVSIVLATLPKCIIPLAFGHITPCWWSEGWLSTNGLNGKWGLSTKDDSSRGLSN